MKSIKDILGESSQDDDFGFTLEESSVAEGLGISHLSLANKLVFKLGVDRVKVDHHDEGRLGVVHWTRAGIIKIAESIGTERALAFGNACAALHSNRPAPGF